MKINKLKINAYGKLKEKEIDLKDGINIIYGQNESGKSTLINFIINSFYGISKNKDGKDISDYDKYKPWVGEEFSGKVDYELNNGEKFEIYRDFNKKSPKIFNQNMEDISKEFSINKNKENEFFYEQTKISKDTLLSTFAINQNEVKLEEQEQNNLMQKIANLAQTGSDNVSYKKVIDKINKRQLDEIGTERSREKPINLLSKKIKELEDEKENLEKYKDFKYNFEEEEKKLEKQILTLENEQDLLKKVKIYSEKNSLEEEKIKMKLDINKKNTQKIDLLAYEMNSLNSKNIADISYKEKNNNRKKVNILNILLAVLIIINIVQFFAIKNYIFNMCFLVTIPLFLVYYCCRIRKLKRKMHKNKNNNELGEESDEIKLIRMENEKKILKETVEKSEEEIEELKINISERSILAKEELKKEYIYKIEGNRLEQLLAFDNIFEVNKEIDNIQRVLNETKLKVHSLELDKKDIEPKLDRLANIEEELQISKEKYEELSNLNMSMNLAKEVLSEAYEKMKKFVTPKFTENLSSNIAHITNEKYNKVMINDEEGLIVELDNGDKVPVSRLSVGTIDQLYLSLRLSMIDELSEESVPVFLDETFAFFDDERLKNVLEYLNNNFNNRQIIIFTCTNREKEILEENNISYNYTNL